MDYDAIIEKYPQLKNELDIARSLQESSNSMMGKSSYKEKQNQINDLIPVLIGFSKTWDENQLRYTIAKIEILRDEIIALERNSHVYDLLLEQIAKGDFAAPSSEDDE